LINYREILQPRLVESLLRQACFAGHAVVVKTLR
jgi:hypothetical protein